MLLSGTGFFYIWQLAHDALLSMLGNLPLAAEKTALVGVSFPQLSME
jgi:hypothetical protein